MIPGEILDPADDEGTPLVLNAGRPTLHILVENRGDRPVQVGSHYHFAEANEALEFDRVTATGHRLDVAPGTAVRFEPGIAQRVVLVPIGGRRIVPGLRGLTAGPLDGSPEEGSDG